MDDSLRRGCRFDVETLLKPLEAVPQPFTPAQHDRHHDHVQVVDQVRLEELPHCVRTAANPDVDSVTGFAMPDIVPSKPDIVDEEPLKAELRSFLEAVRDRSKPVVTIDDGRRALSVALDILKAIQEHSRRTGLDALSTATT